MLATLTNEELTRQLQADTENKDWGKALVLELVRRVFDGRAVLAEPGQELSGTNACCPCCGEEFRALANGMHAY
jgi:hypothetical protein